MERGGWGGGSPHLLTCPACCACMCAFAMVHMCQAAISLLTGRKVGASPRCPPSSPAEGAAPGGSPYTESLRQSGRSPRGPTEERGREEGRVRERSLEEKYAHKPKHKPNKFVVVPGEVGYTLHSWPPFFQAAHSAKDNLPVTYKTAL